MLKFTIGDLRMTIETTTRKNCFITDYLCWKN
jgi:hypothetical protein